MKATLQQIEWTWHLQAGSKRRWGKLEWGVGGGGEVMQHTIQQETQRGQLVYTGLEGEQRMYCSRLTVTHIHITAKKGCLH